MALEFFFFFGSLALVLNILPFFFECVAQFATCLFFCFFLYSIFPYSLVLWRSPRPVGVLNARCSGISN